MKENTHFFLIIPCIICFASAQAQDIFNSVQEGSIEKVKAALTQHKDCIHRLDMDHDTPLHYAAQLNRSRTGH